MKTKLILGGPGSGKTTRLLDVVDAEIRSGTRPDRIAFVSFTKKAASEAKERAMARFNLDDDDLPHFRTLHSLCFRAIDARRDQMMTDRSDYSTIARHLGLEFDGGGTSPDDGGGTKEGDRIKHLAQLARSTRQSLQDVWRESGAEFPFDRLHQWVLTVEAYKERHEKREFVDLLEQYLDIGSSLPVSVAIIDEAQDLTALQWAVVEKAFPEVDRRYVAGDDDQAIHAWMGADIRAFLNIKHDEHEVLPISHRLPRAVFDVATRFVQKHVADRFEKEWGPKDSNGAGFVRWIGSLGELDIVDGSSWFLLGRNVHLLRGARDHVRRQRVPYTFRGWPSIDESHRKAIESYERWRDGDKLGEAPAFRKYMIARDWALLQKNGDTLPTWQDALRKIPEPARAHYEDVLTVFGTLDVEPRITISTIHGVKGGEADFVVVSPSMSRRTYEAMLHEPGGADSEGRVFYVALSRAKRGVYILFPEGREHHTGLLPGELK